MIAKIKRRATRKPFSDEEIEKLKQFDAEHWPISRLAEYFNCSRSFIHRQKDILGIKRLREDGKERGASRPKTIIIKHDKVLIEKIAHLRFVEFLGLHEIASIVNYSHQLVHMILAAHPDHNPYYMKIRSLEAKIKKLNEDRDYYIEKRDIYYKNMQKVAPD